MVQPGHRTWPGALPHLLHDPKKAASSQSGLSECTGDMEQEKGHHYRDGRQQDTGTSDPTYHQSYTLLGRKKRKKKLWEPNQIPEEERDPVLKGAFTTRKTSPLGHYGNAPREDSSARTRTQSLTSCHTPRNIF